MLLVTIGFAIAYASTNIDNLAFMIAIAPRVGFRRAASGFALTQAIAILAAVLVGAAAGTLPTHLLGWLGLIPITLGLRELCRAWCGASAEAGPTATTVRIGFLPLAVAFQGMTTDTFALTATFLADSAPRFDPCILLGAVVAVAVVVSVALLAGRAVSRTTFVLSRLERVAPLVMIASGAYILWDSFSDVH